MTMMTDSSPSGHTSGRDSTKSTTQKGRNYNGRLSSIKTQHFIELLSSIRYESQDTCTCLDKPLKRIYEYCHEQGLCDVSHGLKVPIILLILIMNIFSTKMPSKQLNMWK